MTQEGYIIGAGGFAREIYELLIKPINNLSRDTHSEPAFKVLGFLDDDPHAMDGKVCDIGIVGGIHDWEVKPEERFVMGIANPQVKEKLAKVMLDKGATFVNVIHPWVQIVPGATYGMGFVAYPGATVGPDVHVGDFVTLLYTGLGHDAKVGNYCTISSYCGINGYVELGDRVFVGSHAVIHPNMKIGDDAYVGTGSVVIRRVKPGTKVFGNPAKVMDF